MGMTPVAMSWACHSKWGLQAVLAAFASPGCQRLVLALICVPASSPSSQRNPPADGGSTFSTMRVTGRREFQPRANERREDPRLRTLFREAANLAKMGDPTDLTSVGRARPQRGGNQRPARAQKRPRTNTSADVTAASSLEVEAQRDEPTSDDESDGPAPGQSEMPHMDHALVALASDMLMHASDEADLLGGGDMADDGAAHLDTTDARAPSAAASSSSCPSASSGGAGLNPVAPAEGAEEGVSEVLSNLVEELASAADIAAPEPAAPLPSEGAANSEGDGDILAPAGPGGSGDQPVYGPVIGQPIEGGPPGWVMRPGGYIFDETLRYRCRITAWAKSVSIKAPGGKSKAVRREWATDGELCQWFASEFAEAKRPRPPSAPQPPANNTS